MDDDDIAFVEEPEEVFVEPDPAPIEFAAPMEFVPLRGGEVRFNIDVNAADFKLGDVYTKPPKKEIDIADIVISLPRSIGYPEIRKTYYKASEDVLNKKIRPGSMGEPFKSERLAIGDPSLVKKYILNTLRSYIPKGNKPILLPANCRYYQSSEELQYFLIERVPEVVTLKAVDTLDEYIRGNVERDDIVYDPDSENYTEYKVSLPWQYFWFEFDAVPENDYGISHSMRKLRMFWATQRISSLSDRVFPAMLPNIGSGDGLVCLGDTFPASNLPTVQRVEEIVRGFFNDSVFNADIPISMAYNTLSDWARYSKLNPYLWMEWETEGRARRQAALNKYLPEMQESGAAEGLIDLSFWQILYDAIKAGEI